MERDLFAQRLERAASRARDFARRFFEDELPEPLRFRVRLNASYDGTPLHEDERVYPADGSIGRASQLHCCTVDQVLTELWRDGAVPEWVNLSVIGDLGEATLLEVLSCGRFTRNHDLLYHQQEGYPPFHTLGPSLPPRYEDGDRFSIYRRSDCWTINELARAAANSTKVWSLQLFGDEFDDSAIRRLPAFEKLHILELTGSPLRGSGLASLDTQPELRVLRIRLNHEDTFSTEFVAKLAHLETLELHNLPRLARPIGALAKRAKRLDCLLLSSQHEVRLDAGVGRSLAGLTLRAPRVTGAALPRKIGSLTLNLTEVGDEVVSNLLAPVRALDHLSLRHTPVNVGLVRSLLRRLRPSSIDVVRTRLDEEDVRSLMADFPEIRIVPNIRSRADPGRE